MFKWPPIHLIFKRVNRQPCTIIVEKISICFIVFLTTMYLKRNFCITVRVGDARSNSLGNGSSHHKLKKIFGRFSVVFRFVKSNTGSYQSRFDCFVDDKMHNCFRYSKIRSCNTFVETFYALRIQYKLFNYI